MGQTRKEWLQTVTAQLRCRRAVPGVERELENHLSEQYNAFVAQGCAPEEAERRTVESMGDPVLAGGALDRVHRPRPAWGPFFMVAALLLAGALLRFFWSVPVSAQGAYLWREGAYQSLAAALAGIAVLAAVYFCMDVSLLARWTKALYIGLAAVLQQDVGEQCALLCLYTQALAACEDRQLCHRLTPPERRPPRSR